MDEGKVRFIGVSNLSTYHCPARSRWLGPQRASVRVRPARRTYRLVEIHTPIAEIWGDPDRVCQRPFDGRLVETRADAQQEGGCAGHKRRPER